jgi:hypothetical protein
LFVSFGERKLAIGKEKKRSKQKLGPLHFQFFGFSISYSEYYIQLALKVNQEVKIQLVPLCGTDCL